MCNVNSSGQLTQKTRNSDIDRLSYIIILHVISTTIQVQLHLDRACVPALSFRLVFLKRACFTVSYVVKSASKAVTL